ncbi:MAG: hypothetical protein WCC87_25400 [Candidatus Korobacteraceae bacterium]
MASGMPFILGTGGNDMQGTATFIESEQQLDLGIREEKTREMLDALPYSVAEFCRIACGRRDEIRNPDCMVEKALVCAYLRASRLQGSAEMSTWLTAIALLIFEPECTEAPLPEA